MVTGDSNKRVSLAALIAIKPGCAPRLIYRVYRSRRRAKGQRKGFTETDYALFLDTAHQQLAGPLVVVWDNSHTHLSAAMTKLAAARDWLTIFQLPPTHTNSTRSSWSGRISSDPWPTWPNATSPSSLWVKTRLRWMQYRPGLLGGFLASTGLDLTPFSNTRH
jgi:putative transposase